MNEYISRADYCEENCGKENREGYKECKNCGMLTVPTADVQPVVHGKWDTHDVVKVLCSGKTLDGFCQCEACGDVFPLAYSEYNYCPNCGARMDGDTNG